MSIPEENVEDYWVGNGSSINNSYKSTTSSNFMNVSSNFHFLKLPILLIVIQILMK